MVITFVHSFYHHDVYIYILNIRSYTSSYTNTFTYLQLILFASFSVFVTCTVYTVLIYHTYTEDVGSYTYTYSKCPLVNEPIQKTKNNERINIEDLFYIL